MILWFLRLSVAFAFLGMLGSSHIHAMTSDIEDQIKCIEYGANFRSVARIVKRNLPTLADFVEKMEKPKFTFAASQNLEMNLTESQFNHIKETISMVRGSTSFLERYEKQIITAHTDELNIFRFGSEIFGSEINLSYLTKTLGTTATIFDVESIGLPPSLQGRVFISCAHGFRVMREEIKGKKLGQRQVQVPCPVDSQNIHNPRFKTYEVQALFYAFESDVSFGILDRSVDQDIPLPPIKLNYKPEPSQILTLAGYGGGSVLLGDKLVSMNRVHDGVRRAGHHIFQRSYECWMFGPKIESETIRNSITKEPEGSVTMIAQPGHSGGSALLWNNDEKKFEIVAIEHTVAHGSLPFLELFEEAKVRVNQSDFLSFEQYIQALEAFIPTNADGYGTYLINEKNQKFHNFAIADGKLVIDAPKFPKLNPTEFSSFKSINKI